MPCTRRVSDGRVLTRSNAINHKERGLAAPSYSQLPLPAILVSCAHLQPGTGLSWPCHPPQGLSPSSHLPTVLPVGFPSPPPASGEEKPTRMQKPRL